MSKTRTALPVGITYACEQGMHGSRRHAFLAMFLMTAPLWAAGDQLPTPTGLPLEVRMVLQKKMARHAQLMNTLTHAVVVLDFAQVRSVADAMASEPRMARPLTQDATELNARLPEAFFVEQDALMERLLKLRETAQAPDGPRLAKAYGLVMETCVRCHMAYVQTGKPPTTK